MTKVTKKQLALAAAMMMFVTANAQVFILSDEEYEKSNRTQATPSSPLVPFQGSDQDQSLTTPMGTGVMLLSVLGGAYLFGRPKRNK